MDQHQLIRSPDFLLWFFLIAPGPVLINSSKVCLNEAYRLKCAMCSTAAASLMACGVCLCQQGVGACSKSGGMPLLIGIDEIIWLQSRKTNKHVTSTPGFTGIANRWGHHRVVTVEETQANEVFAVGNNPGQKKKKSRRQCADTFFSLFLPTCCPRWWPKNKATVSGTH